MTIITIKDQNKAEDLTFTQTEFDSIRDLFLYLKERIDPIQIFITDQDTLPKSSIEKINKSKSNTKRQLTDFRG